MDVEAFPRYNNLESATGYTFFKPGKAEPSWLKRVISPENLNLTVDNAIRTLFPNMPLDQNYIKEHGIYDKMENVGRGMRAGATLDIGNLERGRPMILNSATIGMEDPHRFNKNDFLERMLKSGSEESDRLKDEIKRLINKKAEQNSHKMSMLSDEFKKTAVKNKNIKQAFLSPALMNTAMGAGGLVDLGEIGGGLYNRNIGQAFHGVGSLANTLGNTPFVASSLAKTPGALGKLNAFGAPFAAYDALGNIKNFGKDWTEGNLGGVVGDTAMGGINTAMAINGARQGMNTYRSIAQNPVVQNGLRSGFNIARNGLNAVGRDAGTIFNTLAEQSAPRYNQLIQNAPNVINNIREGAGNLLRSGQNIANRAMANAPQIAGRVSENIGNISRATSPTLQRLAPAAFKGLSLGVKALPLAGDIMQGYRAGYTDGNHSFGRAIAGGIGSLTGRIGGGAAGTFVAPGVGTAIGEIAGSEAGERGGAALYDKVFGGNKQAPAAAPGQPVQANNNPVNIKPQAQGPEIPEVGATTATSPAMSEYAAGTNPESVAANKGIADNRNRMLNDPEYKADMAKGGLRADMARDRWETKDIGRQLNPTGAPGTYSGTIENGKLINTTEQNNSIPPLGQPNNNPATPPTPQPQQPKTEALDSDALLKTSGEPVTVPPAIEAVKPMEHIPRPENNEGLKTLNSFDNLAMKKETADNNRAYLQRVTEDRKASGLGANPFIGRITGVEQRSGDTVAKYTPSPEAVVTDQNEILERANPLNQSKLDQVNMLNDGGGSGYNVKQTGSNSTVLTGPDGKVHGTMTVNPVKATNSLGKASSLKRRNTGLGDWVNPKDFEYLTKSALFIGLTPEEYVALPLSSNVETINQFFFPQG